MPPELPLTSTCSFFTRPVRSRTSRAAEIALRAPITDGSSRTSTIPNAALGAFIASIIPARSVISSLRGPTTSVVFVLLEYPAMSIARRMLPRASPRSASRKAACLSVSSLVAMSMLFRNHFDMNVKSIIAIILGLIFLPLLYLYLPLILIGFTLLFETVSMAFLLMVNSFKTASEFEGIVLADFAEERLKSWPVISQFLAPSYEDYVYQAAAILFSIGLPLLLAFLLARYLIRKFSNPKKSLRAYSMENIRRRIKRENTYLPDGSLNPNRPNSDNLKEPHPMKIKKDLGSWPPSV